MEQQQKPQILRSALGLFYIPVKPKSYNIVQYVTDLGKFYFQIARERYNDGKTFVINYPGICFSYGAFIFGFFYIGIVRMRKWHDWERYYNAQILKRDRAKFVFNILNGGSRHNVFAVPERIRAEMREKGVPPDQIPTVVIKKTPAMIQRQMLNLMQNARMQQQDVSMDMKRSSFSVAARFSEESRGDEDDNVKRETAQERPQQMDAMDLSFTTPDKYHIHSNEIFEEGFDEEAAPRKPTSGVQDKSK